MKTIDTTQPIVKSLAIYLADDDVSDCQLFEKALNELPVEANLTTFTDGEELLHTLSQPEHIMPDVLFLDLNMPRKNGFVALGQIKRDEKLYDLPVIVFSTANDQAKMKTVFRDAAHYYITKPAKFSDLKEVIYKALSIIAAGNIKLPKHENFVIASDKKAANDEI